MAFIMSKTMTRDGNGHPLRSAETNTTAPLQGSSDDEKRHQIQVHSGDSMDAQDKKIPCWKRRIGIITHVIRVFNWRLANMEPLPGETNALLRRNVTNTILQSYLVWRRSMLYIAIPALVLNALYARSSGVEQMNQMLHDWGDLLYFLPSTASTIPYHSFLLRILSRLLFGENRTLVLNALGAWSSDVEQMNQMLNNWGDLIYFLPSTASAIILTCTIATFWCWSAWRLSSRILRIGWVISFILPFVPAMVPISSLLISCEDHNNSTLTNSTSTSSAEAAASCDETTRAVYDLEVGIYQYQMATTYAFQLFPIIAMTPWGLSRAALKIRGLLPQSMLSCWILIIMAPFQSIVFLLGLILLIQLGGNVWLCLGTICLSSAPWFFVSRRRFFLSTPTVESEKQVDRTMVLFGILVKLGVIFLFVGALLTPERSVHLVPEGIGRSLVSAVVFGDILFRMAVTNWRLEQDRRAHNTNNGVDIDALFGEIEYSISKAISNEKRIEKQANVETHRRITEVNASALSEP